MILSGPTGPFTLPSHPGLPLALPGVVTLAKQEPRRKCITCEGAGSTRKEVRRFETCSRCGGKGTMKTGKVTVSCSGCNGKGGWNRTQYLQQTCRTCGGSGYK